MVVDSSAGAVQMLIIEEVRAGCDVFKANSHDLQRWLA
jgi:hypothetical protein